MTNDPCHLLLSLNFVYRFLAEQSRRTNDEGDDENEEREGVLVHA